MSGYTPVFGTLFQGSLCGQWPALPVFCTLLPLCNKSGEIDYSFGYLAAVTGWPEDLLREGIAQLEQPDPSTRSPDDDGRRLVRLRDRTEWGWRVVNHGKYREKARKSAFDAARIADGRNAERMKDRRTDPTRPAMTRDDPPSNTNTNTNTEGGARKRATRLPEDWTPSETERAYAKSKGLDADLTAEKFRNYWLAKSGGATKLDWTRTWQNWCIEEAQRLPARLQVRPPKPVPTAEQIAAERKRAIEDNQRELAAKLKLGDVLQRVPK